jgi:hypothetical protein
VEVLELYVYTLRHAAVHCLGDSRDRREGNGAQGDDSMRLLKELRPEGNGDNFGIFRCARRRGEWGVLCACQSSVVIKSDSESFAIISERDHLARQRYKPKGARLRWPPFRMTRVRPSISPQSDPCSVSCGSSLHRVVALPAQVKLSPVASQDTPSLRWIPPHNAEHGVVRNYVRTSSLPTYRV